MDKLLFIPGQFLGTKNVSKSEKLFHGQLNTILVPIILDNSSIIPGYLSPPTTTLIFNWNIYYQRNI